MEVLILLVLATCDWATFCANPMARHWEAVTMAKHKIKPNYRRRLLRLPDLDHCTRAVLNSLGSPASRRVYEYAIDQFIAWYCSEPRLASNRIVVVRYCMHLESRSLAANTINQQLAAVRRLAHEAADAGLLSPELAAGISRVRGVKQLGFRSGNWLSAAQSSEVLQHASGDGMRAKRDYAMLAMLFGCGFRRSELVGLELSEIQMRQGHWAVVDLIGKGGHIRTVPIPGQIGARSVDAGGQNHGGKDLSCGCQDGEGMGEWYLAKCGLVCGQDLLRESGLGAHCATRPATNLREVVPRQWW
jgi:integrase